MANFLSQQYPTIILNNSLQTKQMTDLDLNKGCEKISVAGTNSSSGSPTSLPLGMKASEAFALSNILERKEFEFEGQI